MNSTATVHPEPTSLTSCPLTSAPLELHPLARLRDDAVTHTQHPVTRWGTHLQPSITEDEHRQTFARNLGKAKRKEISEVLPFLNSSSIQIERCPVPTEEHLEKSVKELMKLETLGRFKHAEYWRENLALGRSGEVYVAMHLLMAGFEVQHPDADVALRDPSNTGRYRDSIDLYVRWEEGKWIGVQVKCEPRADFKKLSDVSYRSIFAGDVTRWETPIKEGLAALVKVSNVGGLIGLPTTHIDEWATAPGTHMNEVCYKPSKRYFLNFEPLLKYLKEESLLGT